MTILLIENALYVGLYALTEFDDDDKEDQSKVFYNNLMMIKRIKTKYYKHYKIKKKV